MTVESAPLSLGGNLADFPLADVLTFLNMGQATGAIEAVSGTQANRVFLAQGEVVYATSRAPRLGLPSFLAARGLLTERAAADLVARSQRTGSPFFQLVVDGGVLDREELTALEKILCSEIVFESMRWREGKFAFIRDRRPPDSAPALRISLQNLILEGARRLDEAIRFGHEIQVDRDLVVTLVFPTGRLEEQVVLTPVEWGIISLINGKRTLEEIFSLSPTGSEVDTWRVLSRLQSARMIQLHPREEAAEEPLGLSLFPSASETVSVRPVLSGTLLPPSPPAPRVDETTDRIDRTDVRLLVGTSVTTSYGMYGRRMPARLVGSLAAGEEPVAFELSRPVLTVGRAPSNDVVLRDSSVSKHHAQLEQEEDGWTLSDLGSTNGSWVNGERVRQKRLASGDRIRIGVYTFGFDAIGAARSPD